jgi:DNA recombination protein RmuC
MNNIYVLLVSLVIFFACFATFFITRRTQKRLWQLKFENDQQQFMNEKNIFIATLQERVAAFDREREALKAEILQRDDRGVKLQSELMKLQNDKAQLETRLEAERENLKKQIELIEDSKKTLLDTFRALSSESLKSNNQAFIELASQSFEKLNQQSKSELEKRQQQIETTVKPIQETLNKFDLKLNEVERTRLEAYSGITEQFNFMKDTQDRLRLETSNLVKALRAPQVRGRWGELQLKRVVEMAGMLDHCDFFEQVSVGDEGSRLRPDMVVRLPGNKNIVVDSKAVISSYMESAQAEDDVTKREKLLDHSRHISERVTELSKKSYWDQFENSPEFVVLFLPGESFFSSALEINPALIEQSVDQKVIIATPTSLIAILKAVAYGWKQTALAENAREISELGKELYKRISVLSENFSDLGKKLGQAVDSYNRSLGTLESRVLVSARRFHELKAMSGDAEIESLAPIDKAVRQIQATELLLTEKHD